MMGKMTVTIPKGQHTSSSFDRLLLRIKPIFWLIFRKKKLRVFVRINTDPYDDMGDKDLEEDLSKAFGFNLQAWAQSNKNSIMAAFRTNFSAMKWDVTPYANVDGAKIIGLEDRQIAMQVDRSEWFMFEIDPIRSNEFKIELFKDVAGKWEPMGSRKHKYGVKAWMGSLIGPWHGGKDDDGNGLGGPAPVDINIEIQWEFV